MSSIENGSGNPEQRIAGGMNIEKLDTETERKIEAVWGKFADHQVNAEIHNWLSPENREDVNDMVRRFLIEYRKATHENGKRITVDVYGKPLGLPSRHGNSGSANGIYRILPPPVGVRDGNPPNLQSTDRDDVWRLKMEQELYQSINESYKKSSSDLKILLSQMSASKIAQDGVNVIRIADLPPDAAENTRTVINFDALAWRSNTEPNRGVIQHITLFADSKNSFIEFLRNNLQDNNKLKLFSYALRNAIAISRPVMAPFFDGPIENFRVDERGQLTNSPKLFCIDYDRKVTAWHPDAIPNHNKAPELSTFTDQSSLIKSLKNSFSGNLFRQEPEQEIYQPYFGTPPEYAHPGDVIRQYQV